MKLGLLSLAGVALAAAAGEPFPIPPVLNVWEDFQYVKGSECLNGGETGVWLRKGREAKKLVVYFMGGGGCFNFETCVASKKNPRGGSGTPGYGGILDPDDERNPLRDYSYVWIPYCSGDVYMGNKESYVSLTVGSKKFFGHKNLALVMDRLVPTFPELTDLVITGESAGGFGSVANFDFIAQAWGATDVWPQLTLIDDCGPILNDDYLRPCLQNKWRELWGANPNIPNDCPACTLPGGGGLYHFYEFLQNKYPKSQFGLIESARDTVISLFFGYGKKDCAAVLPTGYEATFEQGLKNATETYLGESFATMMFPGGKHTYTTHDSFFTEKHEGVMLYEWYTQLLSGNPIKINPWDDKSRRSDYGMAPLGFQEQMAAVKTLRTIDENDVHQRGKAEW